LGGPGICGCEKSGTGDDGLARGDEHLWREYTEAELANDGLADGGLADDTSPNDASPDDKVTGKTSASGDQFPLSDERLAHVVRLVAKGFSRCLQIRLAKHGISFGHWTYLRVLWEQDGITQRDLSVRLGLMEPTVHTALTKMLKAGLIRREHKDGNKKKNYIYLSETGRSLRAELEPLAVEVNEVASEGLPDILVDQLRSALIHMYENLSVDEANAVKQGLSMPSTRHLGESK
jgi:DNA-binding MarR family transcriptional regulator